MGSDSCVVERRNGVVLMEGLEVESWTLESNQSVWSSVHLQSGWEGGMIWTQH